MQKCVDGNDKRMNDMKEKKVCIRPNCGKPAMTRHLCPTCYQTASNLVRRGLTTWEKLEKKGCNRTLRKLSEIKKWLLQ